VKKEKKSKCVMCSAESDVLKPFKPSANFTSWDLLASGSGICRSCQDVFSNQEYRRRSWVMLRDSSNINDKADSEEKQQRNQFFRKAKEVLPFIVSPPKPPFAIYTASTGQKQTFLKLFRVGFFNHSRDPFWICDEDLGLIHVHASRARELSELASLGFRTFGKKLPLLEDFSVKDWEHVELCEQIEIVKGDPLWQLIVRLL
jgi:hypothetical protein